MTKTHLIVLMVIIALASFYVYQSLQPPPGVDLKGGNEVLSLVSAGSGVGSLLIACVALILQIRDRRK